MSSFSRERLKGIGIWNLAAWLAWTIVLVAIVIHRAKSHSRSTLEVYQLAGSHWTHGEYLYGDRRGFVYSPLAAAFFTILDWLPRAWATVFWLLVNAAALLGGMWAILRSGFGPAIDRKHFGIAFLLLLPLAIGNLDVMQANALVIGLLMLAFAAASKERWAVAAVCIGVATYLKIYPLSVGLLLVLLAPWRFGWRLVVALVVLGLLPFLFQHPQYVSDQYHFWIASRLGDNRLQYSEKDAPLDLWYLLVRVGHVPLTQGAYRILQVLAGGAIAVFEVVGRLRGWPRLRILAGAFSFVSIWMTLVGPATEGYTYILLAPAAALAFVQAWSRPDSKWERGLVSGAMALLLFAVARNSFMPHLKTPLVMSAQPAGALLLLGACLTAIRYDAFNSKVADHDR